MIYSRLFRFETGLTSWNTLLSTVCDQSLKLSSMCSWRPCYSAELMKHCHNASVTV